MISYKVERIAFAFLFVLLLVLSLSPLTNIKKNYLPINLNLTPDQVIKSEFQIKENYVYTIKSNYLFVFYTTGAGLMSQGNGNVDIAEKGRHTGFYFRIFGFQVNYNKTNTSFILENQKSIGTAYVIHSRSGKYIFEFRMNTKGKYRFSDSLSSDFSTLSLSSTNNEVSVGVLNHLSSEYKIFCSDGMSKFQVLNAMKIKELVGG
ncbi:MAG: hypothetical protein ABF904_11970 [Ethanoligenens sp.]